LLKDPPTVHSFSISQPKRVRAKGQEVLQIATNKMPQWGADGAQVDVAFPLRLWFSDLRRSSLSTIDQVDVTFLLDRLSKPDPIGIAADSPVFLMETRDAIGTPLAASTTPAQGAQNIVRLIGDEHGWPFYRCMESHRG
jgi:hypothetical protein